MIDRTKTPEQLLAERKAVLEQSRITGHRNMFVVKGKAPSGVEFRAVIDMDNYNFGEGTLRIPVSKTREIKPLRGNLGFIRLSLVEYNKERNIHHIADLGHTHNQTIGTPSDYFNFSTSGGAHGMDLTVNRSKSHHYSPLNWLSDEQMPGSALDFIDKLGTVEGWQLQPVPANNYL